MKSIPLPTTLRTKLPKIKRDVAVGLYLVLMTGYVQATILAPKVCQLFRQIAGNDLYSILAGVGGAGLLVANMVDEGDNKLKTRAMQIGLVTVGALNLENLTTMVTGAPWGC